LGPSTVTWVQSQCEIIRTTITEGTLWPLVPSNRYEAAYLLGP